MTRLEFRFTSLLTGVRDLSCSSYALPLPQLKYGEPVITPSCIYRSGDGSNSKAGTELGAVSPYVQTWAFLCVQLW